LTEIALTQGKVAIVDDELYDKLVIYNWFACQYYGTFYAKATVNGKKIYMHRLLMPGAKEIDHINGNGLDNRLENLRSCTRQQNSMNRSGIDGTSSQYKGVSWDNWSKKWKAYVHYNGKQINLGRFVDEIEAAKAHDTKAIELYGEFAWLNFSNGV
jgi:HNH endonuclease/AP2 domain